MSFKNNRLGRSLKRLFSLGYP